jgi:diketogulonate reductase-like aldo/keto reductase
VGQLHIPTKVIGKDVHGATVQMPLAGVGTWLYNNTVAEAEVATALRLGARLIDTANTYGNQVGVAQAIKKSGVPRSELFISTKVPGGINTEATIAAAEQNLQQLGVDSVDLLLTHFPCAMTNPPSNCNKEARQATWKGLETVYKAGKARAIGVSHYCQKHMEDVLEIATVPIAVNQEEWHVGMGPDPQGLVSFCKAHGISYQSFSPLCGPCGAAMNKELITGDLVTSIGKVHNVTGAQVALKWLVQQGSPVVPKSSKPAHLRENLDLFGWELSAEEMTKLTAATSPPSAEPVSGDCKFNETVVNNDQFVV